MKTLFLRPDWNGPTTPFRHTWKGVVNIDQFRWMVRRDVQEQLALAREEIGARHVRAVGMFDDELRVLGADPKTFFAPGAPRLNWQIVDYVVDCLLELGLSPMFTTTFVPGALASGSNTVFSTKSRVDPPRDWREWEQLVEHSVRHALDRYGFDVVSGWLFEAWNEPNLPGFWSAGQEGFWQLWQVTQGAIKGVDARLRVGGPSTARAEWIGEFLDWTSAHNCAPDYLIAHVYNNDSESAPLSPFAGPQEDQRSRSPHFACGVIRGVRELLDSCGFGGEVHWNEWGRSWLPFDPLRESAGEAAFIVKTMSEVSQQADSFAYWNLSDVYDQVGYGAEAFHGNYGMLSLQSLRKPSYHAHQLLGKLGDERVSCQLEGAPGDGLCGALCTRHSQSGRLSVLLWSFDPDHEAPFDRTSQRQVTLALPLGARRETTHLWEVNARDNNVLHEWKEMGSPPNLLPAQIASLRERNVLGASRSAGQIVALPDGQAQVNFEFKFPGAALLELF